MIFYKKIKNVVVLTLLCLTILVSFGMPVHAQSNMMQSEQIKSLLALLQQLQSQLAQIQGGNSSVGQCIQISRILLLGSTDRNTMGEVSKLQQFLKKMGHYTYPEITGYYGPATQQAVKAWQNQENFYEASGAGTIGNASRAKISESCNTATIDQRNVTSQLNKFQLSGTAKSVKFVFVALVPPYTSNATDWNSVYSTGSYIAFTGDTINNVVNEKWNVEFLGIKSGDYEVRVYSNDASTQKLLVTQPLKVSAPEVIKFTAGSRKTVTLGVGQTATDGGITIILNDVSLTNGLSGLPQASFIVQPDGFEAGSYIGKVDGYIPEGGGGIKDEEAPNGGIRIKINSISQSMNTVTFTVEATEPKG